MDRADKIIKNEIDLKEDKFDIRKLNTFVREAKLKLFFEKCGEIYMNKEMVNSISLNFVCTHCRKHFVKIDSFTQHLLDKHMSQFKEILENKSKQDDLESGHSNGEECDKASLDSQQCEGGIDNNKTDSSIDLIEEDPSSPTPQECPLEHENVVDVKNQPHTCPECGKSFKRKDSFRTHMYIHSGTKPYSCDRCPASYACKRNLTEHQRRHTGEKPYECDRCPRRFVSSTEKHAHMRSHTGERPYLCPECGRAYTTSSHLLEHRRRVHVNERIHNCGLCGKAFTTRNNLRAHHVSVHAELPRNHVCSVCKAAFKTASALNVHLKIHSEKQYKCRICSKTFAQHPGLYAHMKTH